MDPADQNATQTSAMLAPLYETPVTYDGTPYDVAAMAAPCSRPISSRNALAASGMFRHIISWAKAVDGEAACRPCRPAPVREAGDLRHHVLLVTVLELFPSVLILHMIWSETASILRPDSIHTARARGLKQHRVLFHTVMALNLGALISGAVITETVRDWPGVAGQCE